MGFAIIPEEVINSIQEYSASEYLVLSVLASYSDTDGLFWPSLATIREKSGLSERCIREALKRLLGLQVIKRHRDKELTPGYVYAWGDKIDVRKFDIFQNQEVRVNSISENEEVRADDILRVNDIKKVRPDSKNAVFSDIEELEEKKKSTFSSSNLNTYGETAKVPVNSMPAGYSVKSTRPGHILETIQVFSHVPEQKIIDFFKKQERIIEKHEPISLERLEYVTTEAIATVMEWPNEETEFTGRGIWGFFCRCWARIRFGDTRINIWHFSALDAESYWHRKNYKEPTEEEIREKRVSALAWEAEQDKVNLYREIREYLADKDKYLEQEESVEKNKSFLDSINANHPGDDKKTVHPGIIEALVMQKERVGEKLARTESTKYSEAEYS